MSVFKSPGHDRQAFWVAIAAAIVLLTGIGIALLPLFTDELWENTLPTSAIMFVVAAIMLAFVIANQLGKASVKRLMEDGIPGTGTIIEAGQTGLYLNKQPQMDLHLEIETPVHGRYQARHKVFVPLMMLGAMTSGRPLPVKVAPNDQTRFTIDWDTLTGKSESPLDLDLDGGSQIDLGATLREHGITLTPDVTQALNRYGINVDASSTPIADSAAPAQTPTPTIVDKQRILATGTAATATVLSSTHTGEIDADDQPVYEVTLLIPVPGGKPIHGVSRVGVPLNRIAALQQGANLPVKIDRANPSIVAVDWDSA